jgi:hypothetical protein
MPACAPWSPMSPEAQRFGDAPDVHLYEPPDDMPDAPVTGLEPHAEVTTVSELHAVRFAELEHDPKFLALLALRDAAVARIRAAIQHDLKQTGRVSEKVLNLIRAFKEDWQDFRFGDLISYDDVFEDSDNG